MLGKAWDRYKRAEITRALAQATLRPVELSSLADLPQAAAFVLEGVQSPLLPQALMQSLDFCPSLKISHVQVLSKPLNQLGNLELQQRLSQVSLSWPRAKLDKLETIPLNEAFPSMLGADNSVRFELQYHNSRAARSPVPNLPGLREFLRSRQRETCRLARASLAQEEGKALARLRQQDPRALERLLESLGLQENELQTSMVEGKDGGGGGEKALGHGSMDMFSDQEIELLLAELGAEPVRLSQLRVLADGAGWGEGSAGPPLFPGLGETVLAYLLPGESLHLRAWGTKGCAAMNGLFKKGLITPRYLPEVRIIKSAAQPPADSAWRAWSVCQAGVFDVEDSGELVAARPWDCTACLQCTLENPNIQITTPQRGADASAWVLLIESYSDQSALELLRECWNFLGSATLPLLSQPQAPSPVPSQSAGN